MKKKGEEERLVTVSRPRASTKKRREEKRKVFDP